MNETQNQPKRKRSRDHSAFRAAYVDLLSAIECYQSLSSEISERHNKLAERFNVPGYLWSWADGYRCAVQAAWYRYKMVHCYVWNGTPIKGEWDTMPEEMKERMRKGERFAGGHYWKNKDGSIGRPFFVSEEAI